MSLKPLGDRLLVRLNKENKTLGSGIIIPESVEEFKPLTGKVLAVGTGHKLANGNRQPLAVSVGDQIIFMRSGALKTDIEGERLIQERDILLVDERQN